MEAEEPPTTMDAEEHPSSKDPSAEDSRKPPIPDPPLELSISEPLVEPHATESQILSSTSELETYTSQTHLELSASEYQVEPHASESQVMSPTPQSELETHASENSLESSISKASVEHSTSKVLEEYSALQNPSPDQVSDALKNGLSSEPRRSSQIREPEMLPEHSLLGPSAKVHPDTSEKEREEEGEYEEGEDASVSTTHTSQPERQLGKKKEKKGVSRDTLEAEKIPVDLDKLAEKVGVSKRIYKEKFGAQATYLFQWEKNAALKATQTGLYIGWRCPHYLWDCFRIRDESKCFCGHLLREHRIVSDISVPCNVCQCRCLMFCFIPSRPEEVGEFWLKRRATFDVKAWRAQCRCKHSHESHAPTGCHPCRIKGCNCNCFESNFLCAACDRRWEEHNTFFETEETRRRGGRLRGADYVPFAEIPTLQGTTIDNSDIEVLQRQGPSGHPSSHPSPPELPDSPSLRRGPAADPRT